MKLTPEEIKILKINHRNTEQVLKHLKRLEKAVLDINTWIISTKFTDTEKIQEINKIINKIKEFI